MWALNGNITKKFLSSVRGGFIYKIWGVFMDRDLLLSGLFCGSEQDNA